VARAASNERVPAPVRWPALQGEGDPGALVGLGLRGKGDLAPAPANGLAESTVDESLLGDEGAKVVVAGRAGVTGGRVPEDEASDELDERDGDRSRSGVRCMARWLLRICGSRQEGERGHQQGVRANEVGLLKAAAPGSPRARAAVTAAITSEQFALLRRPAVAAHSERALVERRTDAPRGRRGRGVSGLILRAVDSGRPGGKSGEGAELAESLVQVGARANGREGSGLRAAEARERAWCGGAEVLAVTLCRCRGRV